MNIFSSSIKLRIIRIYILQCIFLLFVADAVHALTFSGGKENIVHQVSAHILDRAYERIDIHPEFIFLQLQESLNASNSGKTDGEISRIKKITKRYPNLVEVPVVLNYVEGIAFGKDSTVKIRSWSDLSSYKIAITKGAKFIEHGTEGMNRVFTNSFYESFELLNNNEVDLVVAPKTSGLFIIHKYKYEEVKFVGSVLQRLNLYHFLHKKNINLVPKITPVLESMKKSGEIDFLRSSYFNFLINE